MLTSKQYHDLLKAKLRRFSRSQEEWKRFLETSSRMYKYGFKDSVSIFAQKPNATACAEIKTWKKATNRRVIRTSEAIGLVYSTDNVNVTSIRYVFDIANTVKINEQSKTPYFWQIDDTCEERVYNELKQAYGVTDAINFEEAVKKIVRERITYLTKDVQNNIIKSVEGSAAEELDEFALSAVCERFACESATYAILHRCGIEYDADFSDIYNFDTVNAITAVGDIINQTSEEVLRSIEKTMKAILKEEYYERIRETARNDNESDRRRGDNIQIRQGNGNISSVLGYEGGEDRHRQVRQDEAEIPQRAETDTDDVQPVDDKRRAGAAPADSERAVYQQSVGIRGEEQGEVRSDGRIAEQQSARMDENLQFAENDGRGTGAQRDSLRITEQETAVSSENDTVVSLSEENEITETLTGEEIQIILRYDRFLKHSKSEIAGFFLSDSNEINRAEYLKSAYDEAYTEIMVGDQRYGYHNDIHGLELWKGPSYLSMTANMHISWDCAADIVNDMINSHEYLSADELDKQADYVDIEPQKEENGEQLTFFEMNLPAVTESSVLPVENIRSEHFDNLLRLGSIKNRNSRQTIIAYFKKPGHTAQERADFLRSQYLTQYRNEDINDTAYGIKSLDNKLSAYFSESGITLKAGDSVFSICGKSESISWTEATDRIQKMLDEGTYAPQTVIDASAEIEAKQTADSMWELWRDQNEDSNVRLDVDDSDFTHTSETIGYIAEKLLNDREWLEKTANAFMRYAYEWQADRSVQRFNCFVYNPVTVSAELSDLLKEEINYTAQEYVPFPATPYINTDHIEMYFRKHGHIEGAKGKIREYFTSHVDTKAQVTYLKSIYGNSGCMTGEFDFNAISSKGKGAEFKISVDGITVEKKNVSWEDCAKTIFRSIKNDRYTKPSFVAEKTDAENEVKQEEPVKLKSIVIDLTPKESKEPHTDYTEYIGKEFEYENRKYKIDSINEGTVSAQDMTMLETYRYPIFRVLDTETVLGIIREQPSEKEKTLSDYTLSPDDYSDLGGEKSRFRHNIKAIKTLKAIESENRNATPDEQKILAKYVGWGGLSAAFNADNKSWADEYNEVSELLTSEEYANARESTMTAFYTSPEIIGAVYDGLRSIGFDGGNILDPSAGTGNFFGAMPAEMRKNSKLYGVELDSISARIAKQLYQSANITEGAYEKRVLNDNFYDAAISNVPFGQFKVHDKRYDSLNLNIHDYFFAKSLDKVRPGGIIAFITTSGTLDKSNSKFRKYMAERAELLGAVRLPNTAFKAVAGTEVTSDIIFLQKRDKIQSVNSENCEWLDLGTDENGIPMNSYFVNHPDMIIGEMKQGIEYSMYGDATATACVVPEGYDIVSHLHNAVTRIDGEYHPYTPQQDEIKYGELKKETIPADESVDNYTYTLYNGNVYYRENSIMTKVDKGADRIAALIDLKTITRSLLQQQLRGFEQSYIDNTRKELNEHYDAFVKKYGYVNSKANETAFSADSSYYLLRSLEKFDKTDNTYNGKADIFIKNTVRPVKTVVSVSTAVESIGVSLCEKGCIDIPYMASLCGLSEEQTIKDCIDAGAIYKVPPFPPRPDKTDIYVTADEYLSGNIRDKLAFARTAALTNKEYQHNVEALEKVMPKPLTASDIDIRIGVTWLDTKYYDDFIRDTFDAYGSWRMKIKTYYSPVTGEFNVSNKSSEPSNVKVNNEFGTSRMNALQIFEHTLNQRTVKVYDRVVDVDGKVKSVLNSKETEKAQEKQELIKEAFSNWIYRDPERRQNIVDKYNELFNSIRPRTFDGSHLVLHGASDKYKLFDHQCNALARTLYGGNTLLAHVVGAGKTFEMVASAMESKYIGVCHKSLICVPNHIVGQIASDFMELYPGANILVATEKDFEMKNRKLLCSKIATGDYDAVIIGHSQLLKIPLSYERRKQYIREDIRQIENALQDMNERYLDDGQRYSVKQLEKTKKNYEARLEKLTDNEVDDVVTFEELGVDRIYIDEAHMFKNLYMPTKMSNVAGIQMTEAKKSSDLYYKCKYLDEITGGKGVVFATGTPVSNSMTELYTMMRYLQADKLKEMGMHNFDAWAANFGEAVTAIELAPEGTGYRAKTRFSKFFNLPELINVFKECADIKTADMLNLPVPEAHFHNVVVKPSDIQKDMVAALSDRAKDIHDKKVQPEEDNMLKVTNDGRKIGLDQRLIDPLLPDDPNSKVNTCVANVFDIYQKNDDKKSTQLVFCDFSTPKNDGSFNLYDDIRDKLIAKGVPKEEIAFIHEADSEAKKKELFSKVRQGKVRVLLGSTAKCGAGTNIQDKLIALHHLDCPWRPSDLEQREGRIIRQGNENKEVEVYRYMTEATFDAYLYQTIENKQRFISQIMSSKSPVRSCEDVDEATLSYAEVKALCAGNPLIKEKMDLDVAVTKLKVSKANHTSQQYTIEDSVRKHFPERIAKTEQRIAGLEADLAHFKAQPDVTEGISPMTILNKTFTDKEEAGKALLLACKQIKSKENLEIG